MAPDPHRMAAVAVAGSIWAPLSLLGLGSLLALPPLTAQMVGGGDRHGAAHLLRQGIWLTCVISVLFMSLFYAISWRMEAFGLEPELARLAGGYLRAILWGLPGFMLFVNQRSFLEGFSRTRPAMFYYLRRDPQYRDLHPIYAPLFLRQACRRTDVASRRPRFDLALIWRILRIGLPSALALFFEVSLFAVTALLLAPLGTVAVAGHQIATNFSTLMFMFPLALGMTATIRVAARTALGLSVIFALVIAACTVLFRYSIVRIYNDDPVVTSLAAHLLFYAACYQVVDGLQTVALGVLRGYNDTRIISVICFVAYWLIGLPLGFTLARTDWIVPALGPAGFWIAYITALSFGACCYLWRVRFLHRLDDVAIRARVGR